MRRKLDAIATHCLGAIERLICHIQEGGKIGTRVVRDCDADTDGCSECSLRDPMGGGFKSGTQPLR